MAANDNKRRKRGQGEGSIYKRSDGRWAAAISVDYQNGKPRRKTLYGKTRSEVAGKLTDALNKVKTGLPLVDERQTVGEFLDWWLAECIKPHRRYNTYVSYEKIIRVHLKPALAHTRLAKLGPAQVQTFLNGKIRAGLSPRTVALLRTILRAALNQALKWEQVGRNVAQLTSPIRIDKRASGASMKPDEAQKFMEAIEGNRLQALFLTALALGLREGEALGLCWANVDFENRVIKVRDNLQRVNGKLTLEDLKNGSSRRDLPLIEVVLDALRSHRNRQLQERLIAGSRWEDKGFVFTTSVGTPIDRRNMLREYHRVLKAAGLPRFRFHDLRHSCVSFLIANGVPMKVISDILGHSQISTTMDIYAHIQPELYRDALSRMSPILSSSR